MIEFNAAVQAIIDNNNNQVDEFNELLDKYEAMSVDYDLLKTKLVETDKVMECQHQAIKKNFKASPLH